MSGADMPDLVVEALRTLLEGDMYEQLLVCV